MRSEDAAMAEAQPAGYGRGMSIDSEVRTTWHLCCGLGGLRWADVRPLIESAFEGWPGTVHLYAPGSERDG